MTVTLLLLLSLRYILAVDDVTRPLTNNDVRTYGLLPDSLLIRPIMDVFRKIVAAEVNKNIDRLSPSVRDIVYDDRVVLPDYQVKRIKYLSSPLILFHSLARLIPMSLGGRPKQRQLTELICREEREYAVR